MKILILINALLLLLGNVLSDTVMFNYNPSVEGTFYWNNGSTWSTGTPPQFGDDVDILYLNPIENLFDL